MLRQLLRAEASGPILVGASVMYEVLAGLRSAVAAGKPGERCTCCFWSRCSTWISSTGRSHYHALRRRGIALGTVDMIIGTWCIESGAELLAADRDLGPLRLVA